MYQADTQEMPNVDDYIAQKAAVYRLQQDMTNWERKVIHCVFRIRDLPYNLGMQPSNDPRLYSPMFSTRGQSALTME